MKKQSLLVLAFFTVSLSAMKKPQKIFKIFKATAKTLLKTKQKEEMIKYLVLNGEGERTSFLGLYGEKVNKTEYGEKGKHQYDPLVSEMIDQAQCKMANGWKEKYDKNKNFGFAQHEHWDSDDEIEVQCQIAFNCLKILSVHQCQHSSPDSRCSKNKLSFNHVAAQTLGPEYVKVVYDYLREQCERKLKRK